MKGPQERVRSLLIESLSGICCNEIKFKESLKVEGLFGITVDEVEVFLVSVGETFVHNRAISTVSENEFHQSGQMSTISQQLSEMNENSMPVITGKKQKIDLDLQNVSQYLANHEQVSNEHEMEGVMLCGESLTQSDLENGNSLSDMSQAEAAGAWAFPFSKLQQQQQQRIPLEQIDKSKMMAAAITAMRLQHQQNNEPVSMTANNVVALQQLRQSYLAVHGQAESRDDHTSAALEQFQLDPHTLEQTVAVAALQQQLAINLADPASLSLLGNKALVSGLILDQLSQHCVVDDENQQSQSDSDSGIDSKKNANLIQALSGAGGLGSAVLQLNSHHLPKHFRQQHGSSDTMMLHLDPGSSSSSNNIIEGSVGTSKDEDDENNIDSKLWITSGNSEIVAMAPPVYSNLLAAAASSASSSSKSPSPTWLTHHHNSQQQQTIKMSPDTVVDNNLVNSIIESNSTQAALAISSNQFIVGPIYPASSSTSSSSSIQQHAFNLSDLMQQEQLLQQQQQLQQLQQQHQQQQAAKPQQQQTQRQQNRGRKESRRSWTSNNKPNSCPYAGCTKTYFFTHDLKRHLRQKHGEVLSGEASSASQIFTTDRASSIRQQQQIPQLQQQLQAHQFILNDRKDFVLLMPPQLQTKNEVDDDDDNLGSGGGGVRDEVENAQLAIAGGSGVLGIITDKTQDEEMLPA